VPLRVSSPPPRLPASPTAASLSTQLFIDALRPTSFVPIVVSIRCAAIYYAASLLKSAAFKDHASESVHVDASRIIFALALPSESSFVFERSC